MKSKKKLIIFDLDDTLIDTTHYATPIKLRLTLQAMINAGLQISSEEEAYRSLVEIDQNSLSGKETIRQFLQNNNGDMGLLEIGSKAYYGKSLVDFPIKTISGTLQTLNILKDKHDLVLVSFGIEEEQYRKMERAGINPKIFRKIIITENYDKLEAYEQVMKELSYLPENIFVCGDKFHGDLLPAKKLGMKTVHFSWGRGKVFPHKAEEVDHSISDVSMILKIIEGD